MKNYKVTVEYLDQKAEGVYSEEEVRDGVYVELDQEMNKWSGDGFRTAWGHCLASSLLSEDKIYETNIYREGRSVLDDKEVFTYYNELLRDAGEDELKLYDEDGNVVTDFDDADINNTFDEDGLNSKIIEMLNEATWSIEDVGVNEEAVLAALSANDVTETNDENFVMECREVVEKAGYEEIASGGDDDVIYNVEIENAADGADVSVVIEALKENDDVKALIFESKNNYDEVELDYYFYAKPEKIACIVEDIRHHYDVFLSKLEAQYQESENVTDITSESEFDDYAEGNGKWDTEFGFVDYKNEIYVKAKLDDEWELYHRTEKGWESY